MSNLERDLKAWATEVSALLSDAKSAKRWYDPFNDPNVVKHLDRLFHAISDLIMLLGRQGLLFDHVAKERLAAQCSTFQSLTKKTNGGVVQPLMAHDVEALLHEVQLVLIAVADDEVLCALTERELEWTERKTSWLTWDTLFGTECPTAVSDYRAGKVVNKNALEELRHKNLSLERVRHDDEIAHRTRAEERRQNLQILFAILFVALAVFVFAYWRAADPSFWEMVTILVAGAVGASISGTLKARDRLTRQSDIRRFRDGFLAQLLVGASAAVFVVLFLQGGLVTIGDLEFDTIQQQVSAAFVAGFSEPVFLRTIERAGTLGATQPDDTETKG